MTVSSMRDTFARTSREAARPAKSEGRAKLTAPTSSEAKNKSSGFSPLLRSKRRKLHATPV